MSQPQPLSFHPWFWLVIDDKLQAEEKHPKTLLFRSCEGCPHKRYKHATGQTRCSQRVIHFEPPKKRPVLPYQNMANRTFVPRFSSPRHRILYPKFGYGILGIHRIFRICRLVCLWRLAVSKHGHPFQPLKILKITRTGLGVSTPIPKFSSLILVGYWWQTPGWRKTSKNPLILKLQGVPSQKLQTCNRLNRM